MREGDSVVGWKWCRTGNCAAGRVNVERPRTDGGGVELRGGGMIEGDGGAAI